MKCVAAKRLPVAVVRLPAVDGDLAAIAKQINALQALAARTTINAAIEIGDLLYRVKGALPYGCWLSWLRDNVSMSADSAERYMKLSRDPDKARFRNLRDLTEAYDLIGDPERKVVGRWATSKKNDEWYTPAKYIEAARQAFGGTIDVDPASNPLAQQTVKARQYFTKKIDGLKQEWPGAVWLNPPYTMIRQFTDHLLAELDSGHCQSAILLGPSSTDAEWYHRAAARAEAWYFPDHRIKFYDQDGGVQQALWPSVLFYFGPKPNAFCKAFKPIGGYVGLLTSWRPYGVVS